MKYGEFSYEELARYLEAMGMTESARTVRAKNIEENVIEIEDIIDDKVILEYEGLSEKIKKMIGLLGDNKKITEESGDREEKDTLDEKEGKEELDKNKKKEVDKRKQKNHENEGTFEEKEKDDEEIKEEDNENKKKEETPKKDEYLAKLKKLHKMKIVDYKEQMKTGEVDLDKYYMSMIVLQRSLNKQRAAFIKEYGSEELVNLENEYLKEENKYRRTIINNIESSLAKLRAFEQKLEAILDEMSTLQQQLEDNSISMEEYNDRINVLEKDKLDTLWQINKLNPELLEETQDNLELREKLERKATTTSIQKQKKKDMSPLNKVRSAGLKYDINNQKGEAEEINDNRQAEIEQAIDEKEQRIDKIRRELSNLDTNNPEDRKRVGELVEELYSLTSSKTVLEEQKETLEKNMESGIQNYGELEEPETKREDNLNEFFHDSREINYEKQTPEFMEQYKDDVVELSNSSDAKELLDNMEKIADDAAKEKDKAKEEPEDKEKTLFRKRNSSNN